MKKILVWVLPILFIVSLGSSWHDLYFSAKAWNFGTITPEKVIQKELTIGNRGTENVELTITATCECLQADPPRLSLKPGDEATVILSYDPADDQGKIQKYLLIETNQRDRDRAAFLIEGYVRTENPNITGDKS